MNNRKHPLPGSTLSRPAGGVLILVPFRRGLLVKRRVHEIQVLLIHLLLSQPQPFAKALEMHDFPRPQELDDVVDVRIVGQTQDVVIGDPGLLLCCNHIRTTFD